MHKQFHSNPDELLMLALANQGDALGQLLERHRNYLKILADGQIGTRLQTRGSASDIAQEAFLQAHRSFKQFRGRSSAEFLVWLRQILASCFARFLDQHVRAEKRDIRREISLDVIGASLNRSAIRLKSVLQDRGQSPSSAAQRHERMLILADQLAALPEDYRHVLVLRSMEGLSFNEVAKQMERSYGATRMLWFRALTKLRTQLEEKGLI